MIHFVMKVSVSIDDKLITIMKPLFMDENEHKHVPEQKESDLDRTNFWVRIQLLQMQVLDV